MKLLLLLFTVFCILFIVGCEIPPGETPPEKAEEIIVAEEVVPEEAAAEEEIVEEEPIGLHWGDIPLTYFIDESICRGYETRKVKKAFDEIENATGGVVYFKRIENQEKADIEITCSFIGGCYKKTVDVQEYVVYTTEEICAHAAGYATYSSLNNKIIKGKIELIGLAGFSETTGEGPSGFWVGTCGHADVEIHEILHTFGYGHLPDPNSVMYYEGDGVNYALFEKGSCVGSKRVIDKEIIDDLTLKYKK